MLRVENIEDSGYTDTFGKKGREWLDGVELRPVHQRIKQETLETIDRYNGLIKSLDTEIKEKSKKDEIIKRLMTIPGIGQFTAQVIMAEVGNMSRFPTPKHFAGYDRIAYKKGKSKATVAVARKLAVICWCVVMNKAPYDTNKVCRQFG